MRLITIADDDSLVAKGEALTGDMLVSLGDLSNHSIERASSHHNCSTVVAVKGNHDCNGNFPNFVTPLHFTIFEFRGLLFGGFNGSWKYKPRGHHMFEQHEVTQLLENFPRVDVFIAHNSPAGIHERDKEVHQGFEGFTNYIKRSKPKYFLHGHQHVNQTSTLAETTVIGVFGETVIEI